MQVVPYLLKFIDNLTNIYIRFNRKRLKGRTGEDDCRISLSTLYYVRNLLFPMLSNYSSSWHSVIAIYCITIQLIWSFFPFGGFVIFKCLSQLENFYFGRSQGMININFSW